MTVTFRTRLFRLLLLFAVVPSVLLTLFGYYLAVETPLEADASEPVDITSLTDYHSQLLCRLIEREMSEGSADSVHVVSDFVLRLPPDSNAAAVQTDTNGGVILSDEAIERLQRAAGEKPQGLIECDGQILLYTVVERGTGDRVIAGVRHDSTYSELVESLQARAASHSARMDVRASYISFVGGLFVVVVAITILAAYLLSSKISGNLSKPLVSLSEASQRIAEGEFRQTVPVQGDRELRALIENFNQMAISLDAATSRLAQMERVAAWRQVARRFAHELKNPLQPILVSLYRIEKQLVDTPQWENVREPLRAASEEVKHLTSLAERFSHLAKLPPPKMEAIDLRALLADVSVLYAEKMKPLVFSVELADDAGSIKSDVTYLREILHNLLQNAVDACQDGDGITVRSYMRDKAAVIEVADTGSGMDAATLAAARLPYYTTKTKGTGLGLAIVERAINEMGGTLSVVSSPGVGTTITVTLPRQQQEFQ